MKNSKHLFLILASLISTGVMAQTTPPAKQFALDVKVHTNSSTRFLAGAGLGDPTHFDATLRIAEDIGSLPCYDVTNYPPVGVDVIIDCAFIPPKADFYFGVIGPGGKAYSFAAGENSTPIQGLVPIATDVDVSKAGSLNLSENAGSISYTFSYDDAPGMYTVFALLVMAGENPANSHVWLEAEMQPLMVEPFMTVSFDNDDCNLCNDMVVVP
jgi:hypothetical protein